MGHTLSGDLLEGWRRTQKVPICGWFMLSMGGFGILKPRFWILFLHYKFVDSIKFVLMGQIKEKPQNLSFCCSNACICRHNNDTINIFIWRAHFTQNKQCLGEKCFIHWVETYYKAEEGHNKFQSVSGSCYPW